MAKNGYKSVKKIKSLEILCVEKMSHLISKESMCYSIETTYLGAISNFPAPLVQQILTHFTTQVDYKTKRKFFLFLDLCHPKIEELSVGNKLILDDSDLASILSTCTGLSTLRLCSRQLLRPKIISNTITYLELSFCGSIHFNADIQCPFLDTLLLNRGLIYEMLGKICKISVNLSVLDLSHSEIMSLQLGPCGDGAQHPTFPNLKILNLFCCRKLGRLDLSSATLETLDIRNCYRLGTSTLANDLRATCPSLKIFM